MAVEYLSWWPLSSWISPGAGFFLFVNVLIGAIVVTSRGHHQAGGRAAAASTATRRLCRSASSMVLDRLRSFSIFSVHPVPMEELEECYRTSLETAVAEPASTAPVAAAGAPPADGAPSSEFAKEEEEEAEAGSEDNSISSYEAHGLALQGLTLTEQPLSAEAVNAAAGATAAVERLGKEKAAEQEEATVQRAPACRRETEEALEGKAALNARAESFIRKFREDLMLERLNSIINYTRTLRRGAGAPPPTAQ